VSIKHTDRYTVDEKLFHEAHEKVEKLLAELFGVDYEESPNVDFILIDRQRCERMHFHPVPYSHTDNYSDAALEKALEMAVFNLSIAAEVVRRVEDQRLISARHKKEVKP